MCKQLLLFAQTTCSFWTQTKLWRTMGCVNSVGCVGDALHERSISTWCRLHQMVGPGRTAASSNRTHTDLQKNGASSARNTPTCFCFFLRSATFLRRGGTAGDARHYISLKETRDGFVLALTFVCKVKTEEGGKKKKLRLLSAAKALGGTKNKKVIKRVITKSQQESGNATYSISLSYGIYRKKLTNKEHNPRHINWADNSMNSHLAAILPL